MEFLLLDNVAARTGIVAANGGHDGFAPIATGADVRDDRSPRSTINVCYRNNGSNYAAAPSP